MAHHYAFAMKVAAEQEPKRPSLRHKLEGENRPHCAKEGRTAKSHTSGTTTQNREEPRMLNYRAKPRRKLKNASMSTKPKKAKPGVGRLSLELEGAC